MSASPKRVLVTGAAGFIGSHLVKKLLLQGYAVLSVDALTYAGNKDLLGDCLSHPQHDFQQLDVNETEALLDLLEAFRPEWIFHLAAETHVDRSILDPFIFLKSNALGTGSLLNAATQYWNPLPQEESARFRLIHVSTDEVFGSLGKLDAPFTEESPYRPRSPYAASKAASDHMVRAWMVTYGLPAIISHCCNNFGPKQYPEKLIPLVIRQIIQAKPIPIYGNGEQSREWIFVEDHCDALIKLAQNGTIGESYLIGSGNEWVNRDLVKLLCELVAEHLQQEPRYDLIEFVKDRPGHDFRYATNTSKLRNELAWKPESDFTKALRETVGWYLDQREFLNSEYHCK